MALPGNRSPSPISTRPNPNSRTPETNSTMRRSFSGSPFAKPSVLTNPRSFTPITPANSPADLARRQSIGKEGGISSRGYEDKENEKDQNLKPVKVRSPAVAKGAKNFMTPTISAASKINASPRKKVLAERNEPLRTSISCSDGKSSFSSVNLSDVTDEVDSKSEVGLNQSNVEENDSSVTNSAHKEAVLEIPLISSEASQSQVPLNSQKASESLSDMKPVESNCASSGTSCKNKPSGPSMSPIIAPLDADPSLPPYDPKTNFLSPRPQFLHYKPNPRIEVYLHKEKGLGTGEGKRLEESFLSESFSDTEVTEETESENSQKESEDASSDELVNKEAELHVSEPKPNSVPINSHISVETVEGKRVLKPQFFTRSKSIALLLFLLITCLSVSVTDSPVFDSSVYKDLSISEFYDPSEIAEFAKASFDAFAINFKQWSANSLCYLSKLIPISDEVDKLGPLQFSNMTSLLEDPFVDGYLEVDHIEERSEEIHEQDELEPGAEGEVEIALLEDNLEKGDQDVEADDNSEEEALEGQGIEETHLTLEAEIIEPDSSEAETVQTQEQSHTALPISAEDQSALTSKAPEFRPEVEVLEIDPEVVEHGAFEGDNDLSSGAEMESTIAEANRERPLEMDASFGDAQNSKAVDASPNGLEEKDKFSVHYMQTILLLALALVAATTSIYLKHKRTTTPSAAVLADPILNKKVMISSPASASTEVDVVGESWPSEMSSFQTSSSYSKRLRTTSEAQSQERRQRKISKRESLASSSSEYSMGSPSYGSFTTYEKIPIKHGYGDEEIVTPVRRSSRIKYQVTSP